MKLWYGFLNSLLNKVNHLINNTMYKSPPFSLNKTEALKTLRDSLIISAGVLIERMADLIIHYDFAEAEWAVTVGAGLLAVFLNRYINFLRVSDKGEVE